MNYTTPLATRIDRVSPVPLYSQLREILRRQIESGRLKPGDQLPPEKSLEEEYGLSRITVRQALHGLVDEGYLTRSRGRGTFVAERKLQDRRTDRISGVVDTLREQGFDPQSRVLDICRVPTPAKVASILQTSESQTIVRYRRLITVDGSAIALATGYVAGGPELQIDAEILERFATTFPYLAEYHNIRLVRGYKTLEAALANDEEALYLGIKKGAPVLLSESVLYSEDDRPRLFIKVAHRGDRYAYYVRMTG